MMQQFDTIFIQNRPFNLPILCLFLIRFAKSRVVNLSTELMGYYLGSLLLICIQDLYWDLDTLFYCVCL